MESFLHSNRFFCFLCKYGKTISNSLTISVNQTLFTGLWVKQYKLWSVSECWQIIATLTRIMFSVRKLPFLAWLCLFSLFGLLSPTQKYCIDLTLTWFLIKQGVQLIPLVVLLPSQKQVRTAAAHWSFLLGILFVSSVSQWWSVSPFALCSNDPPGLTCC